MTDKHWGLERVLGLFSLLVTKAFLGDKRLGKPAEAFGAWERHRVEIWRDGDTE